MRYSLAPFPDTITPMGVEVRARAASPELDVIGDMVFDLLPGETLDGLPYEEILAAARRDGFIDIPDPAE